MHVRKILILLGLVLCIWAVPAAAQAPRAKSNCVAKWEPEIKKFEEDDRQKPVPSNGVLFIGSSSIRLWQDLAKDFPAASVLNRGFGGSEIADSTCYADRIVAPYRPKLIVLYAGGNDLANGKTAPQVFADFREFVNRVRRDLPETRVAYISIAPNPARWHLIEQVKAANTLIKNHVARDPKLTYIDVFTAMLGPDSKPRPELFVEDRLHMNRRGYEIWRTVVAPHVQ